MFWDLWKGASAVTVRRFETEMLGTLQKMRTEDRAEEKDETEGKEEKPGGLGFVDKAVQGGRRGE